MDEATRQVMRERRAAAVMPKKAREGNDTWGLLTTCTGRASATSTPTRTWWPYGDDPYAEDPARSPDTLT
jgi:hypothetical protein